MPPKSTEADLAFVEAAENSAGADIEEAKALLRTGPGDGGSGRARKRLAIKCMEFITACF